VKIAITVWGNRVSPVFDSANILMIAKVENFKIINRKFAEFNPESTTQILSDLNNLQVNVLLCGAIMDVQAKAIEKAGIKLISSITGDAYEILVSLLENPHKVSDFLMPGQISDSNRSKNLSNFIDCIFEIE
jgi:predicted Fe-Mo cluster-binding NifX family protein